MANLRAGIWERMTSAVIACQAATCLSSAFRTRASKSTSPARAIGSEIRVSLLRMADWIDRAESAGWAERSLFTGDTSPWGARTWRHCHGVRVATARMNASTSAVCGPNRCDALSLACWIRPSSPCEAGATPVIFRRNGSNRLDFKQVRLARTPHRNPSHDHHPVAGLDHAGLEGRLGGVRDHLVGVAAGADQERHDPRIQRSPAQHLHVGARGDDRHRRPGLAAPEGGGPRFREGDDDPGVELGSRGRRGVGDRAPDLTGLAPDLAGALEGLVLLG